MIPLLLLILIPLLALLLSWSLLSKLLPILIIPKVPVLLSTTRPEPPVLALNIIPSDVDIFPITPPAELLIDTPLPALLLIIVGMKEEKAEDISMSPAI